MKETRYLVLDAKGAVVSIHADQGVAIESVSGDQTVYKHTTYPDGVFDLVRVWPKRGRGA